LATEFARAHRKALQQLLHGGVVKWLQIDALAQARHALAGSRSCVRARCQLQSRRRSVRAQRTAEGHRQEAQAALHGRLGRCKAHLSSDAVHHHRHGLHRSS
jgi:hypothetical protein